MIKEIKKGIVMAVSFALTLLLIGVSYAAWVELSEVDSTDTLSSSLMNNVINNQKDLNTRIDSIPVSSSDSPIGTILAWHKDLAGVILPDGWVECDGSVINDIDSPLNGQNTPNLNNQVYSGGKGYYLRGGNISGLFNPSTARDDNGSKYNVSGGSRYGVLGRVRDMENSSNRVTYSSSQLNHENYRFQVAAMTVVYIMKIK